MRRIVLSAACFAAAVIGGCEKSEPPPPLPPAATAEQAQPAPNEQALPVVSMAPAVPPGPALKPKVDEFKAWFDKLELTFTQQPLADGTPRIMGKSEDGLTIVEMIGHGQRLERTSLMFGMAKDAPPASLVRNTGAVMVFMRELGWENGWKWATDAIGKQEVKKRHDDVNFEMQTIADTGICILSAAPAPSGAAK